MSPSNSQILSPFSGYSVRLITLLALLFAGIAAHSTRAAEADPVVSVTGGAIRGRLLPEGGGSVFKGIPFAQPPVGELRWREPMPVLPWTGVREADKSGPAAAQASFGWNDEAAATSREDCLYLDVWTPSVGAKAPLPVMVWIHGGGNVGGAGGSDPLYDGRSLISHGVILVVIEYRLGILGFFAHPELSRESSHKASGNYGILDQIAALRWVHDNISHFGGDPGRVTVFGQSAGSFDIVGLLGSPLSKGLLHGAIAESGSPTGTQTQLLSDAEKAGARAAEQLGAPAEKTLSFLRSLSPADLFKVHSGVSPFVADGWVFPAVPGELAPTGKAHPVPLIIGTNGIEFPASGSLEDRQKLLRNIYKDLTPRALALYGLAEHTSLATDPLYGDANDQLGSDLFRLPVVIQGEWHSAAGNPVWEYEFNRAIPPRPKVGHSSELPYVFGNLLPKGSQAGEFQEADRKLSANLQAYWTNFAKTGTPNGPGLPLWPNFDAKGRKYLIFTTTGDLAVGENERGPFVDLFRELLSSPAK